MRDGGAATKLMQVRALCDRPLLFGDRGWLIAGRIHDVWLDPAVQRVAAFEVHDCARGEFVCVAPFTLRANPHLESGLDADPETWTQLDRAPHWTSARSIEEVIIVSGDGDWSCDVTDAECDPLTWRLVRYRIRRPRWRIFGRRTLAANVVVGSSADAMIVDKEKIA